MMTESAQRDSGLRKRYERRAEGARDSVIRKALTKQSRIFIIGFNYFQRSSSPSD
jgi:hypothetical protein